MNKYDDTDYLIEREESIEYEEGTDINVGSMEKDIKRCEELIKPEHANWIGISNQLAIAHIVDRVKEVENDLTTVYLKGYADAEEKYRKKIKELEEYIFIAPNLDKMTATKYSNIQMEGYVRGREEEQQKAKKIIHNNYITKRKVKDKIDELKQKYEDSKDENGESPYYYPSFTIKTLEELLEDK